MHNGSCTEEIRVWDPLLRLFHWSLVLVFALAWLTGDEWMDLHRLAGYSMAALLFFRLLWGVVGPRHARFADFVRGPSAVKAHLLALLQGRAQHYDGHNPAGGAMVVMLLTVLALVVASGLLADAFGGSELFEALHELLANLALMLVGLHIAGVLLMSVLEGENLVRAMVTGRKRARSCNGRAGS